MLAIKRLVFSKSISVALGLETVGMIVRLKRPKPSYNKLVTLFAIASRRHHEKMDFTGYRSA